jgi:hypothetical protein
MGSLMLAASLRVWIGDRYPLLAASLLIVLPMTSIAASISKYLKRHGR